jgi:hypothetical protein
MPGYDPASQVRSAAQTAQPLQVLGKNRGFTKAQVLRVGEQRGKNGGGSAEMADVPSFAPSNFASPLSVEAKAGVGVRFRKIVASELEVVIGRIGNQQDCGVPFGIWG